MLLSAWYFGGSLNLNLHFHAVFADGVFAPDGAGRIHFHGVAPPSQPMLDRVVRLVRDRALRWLRKHGLLDARPAEDRSNERMEGGALDACADLALRGGAFASLDRRGSAPADDGNARFELQAHRPFTAELDGFNVQAACSRHTPRGSARWCPSRRVSCTLTTFRRAAAGP